MAWLQENWFQLVSALLGLVALIVAVAALTRSREANRLAGEAIDQSKAALIETQRPWLTARVRSKDSKVLEVVRRDDRIDVRVRIELRNTGNSVAKRISVPSKMQIQGGHRVQIDPGFNVERPAPIDLAPGDSIVLTITTSLGHEDLDALESDLLADNHSIEAGLVWGYESELDDRCYKTRLQLGLRLTDGRILRQDHETLDRAPCPNAEQAEPLGLNPR
jgi:hypothetical protein